MIPEPAMIFLWLAAVRRKLLHETDSFLRFL